MTTQQIICENLFIDDKPAGGNVKGLGIEIHWQNGALGRGEDRKKPNGAFVEHIIYAALQRIEYYQSTRFKCRENDLAMMKLQEALMWLNKRTQRREDESTEGTHEGN